MTTLPAPESRTPRDAVLLFITTGICAFAALLATAFTEDPLFRLQGWIFLGAFLLALSIMTVAINSGRLQSPQDRRAHVGYYLVDAASGAIHAWDLGEDRRGEALPRFHAKPASSACP